MQTFRFQVLLEQDEDGYFVAEVPALPACYTQGKTYEEAVSRIHELMKICVKELLEDGGEIDSRYPEIIGIKTLELAV